MHVVVLESSHPKKSNGFLLEILIPKFERISPSLTSDVPDCTDNGITATDCSGVPVGGVEHKNSKKLHTLCFLIRPLLLVGTRSNGLSDFWPANTDLFHATDSQF